MLSHNRHFFLNNGLPVPFQVSGLLWASLANWFVSGFCRLQTIFSPIPDFLACDLMLNSLSFFPAIFSFSITYTLPNTGNSIVSKVELQDTPLAAERILSGEFP